MKLGEFIKVHLPGEAPWAECVAIHDDGTWDGRIDNHLVVTGELHDFKLNDVIRFGESRLNHWVQISYPSACRRFFSRGSALHS